jgi:triacylglycerol lipase
MTTAYAVLRLIGMDMGKLVDRPLNEILDMPEVRHVFDSIKLGTAVPTPPVLIVQAVHDRIVSVEDIDELTDTYRSGGASVTYHRDMFSEHMLLHPLSAPMAMRWMIDRFNGKPLSEHMVRTKWPTLLNPMTYVGMARLAKIAAKVMTGRTVERSPL